MRHGMFDCTNHSADRSASIEDGLSIDHLPQAAQSGLDEFQIVGELGRMPQAVVKQDSTA
jgi:hypothetical protein